MIQIAAGKEHEEKLDAKAAILNKKNTSQNYTTPHQEQTLTLGMPKTMFGKVLEA